MAKRKETVAVRAGQVWVDCDSRLRGERTLKVLRIEAAAGAVVCAVYFRGEPMRLRPTTRIRLSRFRPGSTGYRLLLGADRG